MRQTFARIDLSKYRRNICAVREAIGPNVQLMAVVKANAYGHGLVPIARAAQEEQADFLAVALMEEGIALRQAGINLPILVLAGLSEESTLTAVKNSLTLTVHTSGHLEAAKKAAIQCGKSAEVHIKLDTGMNRIGVKSAEELQSLLSLLDSIPQIQLKGAFTHFASADSSDPGMTDRQLSRFHDLIKLLPQGILLHTSGTSALLKRPDARFAMVRAGISLYGYSPVPPNVPLQPVLSWLAEITHIKEISTGETVSYGATMTAQNPMKVATLAVGYGDGFSRLLSNNAEVLINSCRCRVLGRICMDQTMVDISQAGPVSLGGQAILLGGDGPQAISADELAARMDTISYEVLLSISNRVPRVYSN